MKITIDLPENLVKAVKLRALREGRIFSSIDGIARFTAFEASASNGGQTARIGEYLDVTGPVSLQAQIAAPAGTTLTVLKNGEALYETHESSFKLDIGGDAGAYHFEAHLPGTNRRTSVPWILAGVRVSVAFAIVGAIVGEFISARAGIGYMIDRAAGAYDTTGMMVPLFTLMFCAVTLDFLLVKLTNYLLRWRASRMQSI